jgi:hypothetical protein
MTYTIESAAWINEDGTAAAIQTPEAGGVIVSEHRPDLWAAFVAWCDAGGVPDAYVAPPVRYVLGKLLILDRLIAAGKADAAMTALDAAPLMRLRWDAAVEIYSDDADVIALLTAIGADPAVILAPAE